jgi:hypothetical protein
MKKTRRHRGTERKDEGGRMMDEKEETSITVSSFITHPSSFPVLSVPLCLRVYSFFADNYARSGHSGSSFLIRWKISSHLSWSNGKSIRVLSIALMQTASRIS